MNNPVADNTQPEEVRQKALQEELRGLVDVVGPGPLVDLLLERSYELNATDIHFDPHDEGCVFGCGSTDCCMTWSTCPKG